jgi:hypothetical protein
MWTALVTSFTVSLLRVPIFAWNLMNSQVRADIHASFNHGDWALVPSMDILQKIKAYTYEYKVDRKKTPPYAKVIISVVHDLLKMTDDCQILSELPQGQFWTYSFLPLKLYGQSLKIFRRQLPEISSNEQSHISYELPYNTFPTLLSHAHPYFVLANAVDKFVNSTAIVVAHPFLRDIWDVLIHIQLYWDLQPPDRFLYPPPEPRPGPGPSGKRKPNDDPDDEDDESPAKRMAQSGGRATRAASRSGMGDKGKAKQDATTQAAEHDQYPNADATYPSPPATSLSIDDGLCSVDSRHLEGYGTRDRRLLEYAQEKARSPRTTPWDSWRTSWRIDSKTNSPVTSEFSSNDWAVYYHMRYLPLKSHNMAIEDSENEEQASVLCGGSSGDLTCSSE